MDDSEVDLDDKVVVMNRPKSILDLINNATGLPASPSREPASPPPVPPLPPVTPPAADDEMLPLAGDAYLAHSRAANKPQIMLCLVQKPPALTCLAYHDLRFIELLPPDKPGGGPPLLLKFPGIAEVRLEGRNLDRLVDLLRRHCLAWLREQLPTRGGQPAGDDGSIVITAMRVKALG